MEKMLCKVWKNRPLLIVLIVVLFYSNASYSTTKAGDELSRDLNRNPIIQNFIEQMVTKHKFDRKALVAMFDKVKTHPIIIDKLNRPAESWPWYRYRKIFLKPLRIAQGVEFWEENEALLKKAESEFGVDAQVIVGILGVETRYGRRTGDFRVVDALTTITVDYPRRSKYFKKELMQLLLLAREEKIDPLSFTGSYAGAMGKAQFMPSSYRHYAVDFDKDGHRDLIDNTADAIGSVASYLSRHGYQLGQAIAERAEVTDNNYKKYLAKGMKPKVKIADIGNFGVKTRAILPASAKASLIELEQKADGEQAKEYWLGMSNFYAITRYNHSNLYAMAVFQLSEEIKTKRKMRQQQETIR